GRRAPVAEQPRLDVLPLERHLEQRVVEEVDLADRQVVGGPPVGVHLPQLVGAQRPGRRGLGAVVGLLFHVGGCRSHWTFLLLVSTSLIKFPPVRRAAQPSFLDGSRRKSSPGSSFAPPVILKCSSSGPRAVSSAASTPPLSGSMARTLPSIA